MANFTIKPKLVINACEKVIEANYKAPWLMSEQMDRVLRIKELAKFAAKKDGTFTIDHEDCYLIGGEYLEVDNG